MERVELYRMMARARAVELALEALWQRGQVPGEMHLGTGEEAVAAGTVALLRQGDAVALDHRPTPVLTMLGVDPAALLKECMGREDGLCRGRGGHMHLFSPDHLAASSGIVGAAGPLGAGFALSARLRRDGGVSLAYFGDGAANQGMLLESMNLAAAWRLPVIFVCKDNGWAITTRSERVTGGALLQRADAFGLTAREVDGLDPAAVHKEAGRLVERARKGKGPGFLLARTTRLDGHLCGDPMLRMARKPVAEGSDLFGKVINATLSGGGGGVGARAASMANMLNLLRQARKQRRDHKDDPLVRCRRALKGQEQDVERIDEQVGAEIDAALAAAMEEVPR